MFSSIYLKTLFNLRWQLLGWGLGAGLMAFVTMAFYNSFSQSDVSGLLDSIPESLKPIVGSVDDLQSISGYIGQQIFGPNGYVIVLAGAIMIAISASASQEDDKRLQTLLTMPVTRTKVFLQKWLAVLTAAAVICAALIVGLYAGLFTSGNSADFVRVAESALACFLMISAFASVTFGAAMFTGKKGLTILIASGYAAASFIITSLAMSVSADALKHIDLLSVLHYYNNPLVMQHGLDAGHALTLAGIIAIVAAVSWLRFRSRDIGT